MKQEEFELVSAGEVKEDADNVYFAWRQLEVSNRLQDQTCQFLLFCSASAFTPEFLTEFIVNYHRHGAHLLKNYSAEGNHLLFEAQRMVYAGVFFPELKDAAIWRESGINILNRGCNGFRNEFPSEYLDTVKNMIAFYANICFPDYPILCFSDAKLGDYQAELANYRDWLALFPDCDWIRYYATEGREGAPFPYLSHGALTSGFFTFRNGWKKDATVMVVKAGPKGEWHCQPDNGTFELWFNGRNLFPDTGAYVYAGSAEVMKLRNWLRQTRVHNTLTLDGRNLETTQSVTGLWQPEGKEQILVTENPGYKGLKHRRTVFLVDQAYFVIVDEATGNARGTVNLNYHFREGEVNVDAEKNMVTTAYEGSSNVKLQCFPEKSASLRAEEGWRSTAYRQRVARTSVAFDTNKDDAEAVRYITVIYPVKDVAAYPVLEAKFLNKGYDEKGVEVEVSVNGTVRRLASRLN